MVLKRKRDGEYVDWRAGNSHASSSVARGSSPPRPTQASASSSSAYYLHSNAVLDLSDSDNIPPLPAKRTRSEAYNAHTVPPPVPAPSMTSASYLSTSVSTPPAKPKRTKATARKAPVPSAPAHQDESFLYNPPPMASTSAVPPPAAKPKRGRKDPNALKPEKRLAQFKPRCPQNILDRVERVRQQRIFMIDRSRVDGELKEEFKILGTTMNVYTVTIDHKPRCSCPDNQKGNHCKHILFVFLKVLQVTQDSGLWYQKALLTSELETIFSNAPPAPNSLAHERVREAYRVVTGASTSASTSTSTAAPQPTKRIPQEDDDCPICYDGMHGVAEASLVFCDGCGNALHKECFAQWKQTSQNQGKSLTCVWCRAAWSVPAGPARAPVTPNRFGGNYLNLSGVAGAGISPERDTSSYYHGPRRGQRYYGYNDYDD